MQGPFGLQFPIIPNRATVNILILYRVLLSWDYSSRIAIFRNLHLSCLLGIVRLCSVWHSHQLCMNLCFSRPMLKDYTTYCFPICWVLRISHSWFHFAFLKFLVRLSGRPAPALLFIYHLSFLWLACACPSWSIFQLGCCLFLIGLWKVLYSEY